MTQRSTYPFDFHIHPFHLLHNTHLATHPFYLHTTTTHNDRRFNTD